MPHYKVRFMKRLLSSDGHQYACPQQEFAIEAESPAAAVELGTSKFVRAHGLCDWRSHADSIDVDQLSAGETAT
jgi:hypothetical protein